MTATFDFDRIAYQIPEPFTAQFRHWLETAAAWLQPRLDESGDFLDVPTEEELDEVIARLVGFPMTPAALLPVYRALNAVTYSEPVSLLRSVIEYLMGRAAGGTIPDALARLEFLQREVKEASASGHSWEDPVLERLAEDLKPEGFAPR